jgi:hypothetical protein
LEVFDERCFLVLFAIDSFKNIGIIIIHDRMHSTLVHGKACDDSVSSCILKEKRRHNASKAKT